MSETLSNVFSRKKPDSTQATQNATLFEKLGGVPAVSTAVDVFYRKVMRDARINYFFFGVNLTEQAEKQKAFLTMAFGGPHQYTGRDMQKSHAKLVSMGMNDRHFDIVVEHLTDTLRELGIQESLVEEVAQIAESTREDVMGRSAATQSARVRAPQAAPKPATAAGDLNQRSETPPHQVPASAADPQLMGPIRAILSGKTVSLAASTSIREAIDIFARGDYSSLPVVAEDGRLIGTLTATDLLRHLSRGS